MRRWGTLVVVGLLWGGGLASLGAATPQIAPSPTNLDPREVATQLIPFAQLTDDTQERLWSVCQKPTLHRRLPVQNMECNHDMYLFFLRNPEVIVNMWQIMGVTNVNVKRTGQYTFDANDGAGTQSKMELIYGTRDTQVMFGEGTYEGPLLKRQVNGRCVMVMKSGFSQPDKQAPNVTSQLDVFLQLDNAGADLIVKTLHPLLGKTADHNFAETCSFVGRVSQAIERNPSGAERLAGRLTNISPEVKQQFVRTAERAGKAAAVRTVSLDNAAADGILPPTRVPSEPMLRR